MLSDENLITEYAARPSFDAALFSGSIIIPIAKVLLVELPSELGLISPSSVGISKNQTGFQSQSRDQGRRNLHFFHIIEGIYLIIGVHENAG